MLWADKYRPKDLSGLDFGKQQANDLKNLTKDGDFPHLLVYGPLGAGKKTRVMCLLRELYGPGVDRVKTETVTVTTPSNKKLEIMTINSTYHVEVNPSDVGIYDRVVIMDIIKNVAQNQQINTNVQREFKVVVLTDVDDLTKDAQHALRRTMEKYISNCRIILCATSISRVIPAIRSRCLCIRVPAPSENQIVKVLQTTADSEKISLPKELAERIATASDRNLRRALLMLETCKVEQYPFSSNQQIPAPDWEVFIKGIAALITSQQNVQALGEVRKRLYELIVNSIPSEIIFKTLLRELIKKCDSDLAMKIIEDAAMFEHRLVQGNKEIFHLEAFVAKFMWRYQEGLKGLLEDVDF